MIPGPVFAFELLTTARRGRFYLMRASYAAMLLAIFWILYLQWAEVDRDEPTMRRMQQLAVACFGSIAVAQVVVVLALTPALVSGVIADEKQRKTLHYLLASRLSGPEIVLGKLLARMLHVAVLLAVGFPVLSLLVLLGGIDPRLIVLACAAAASTAWFLAALSIWVSTIARRAREALLVTYGLEFLWLFPPLMISVVPATGWPALDRAVEACVDALRQSTPVETGMQAIVALQAGGGSPMESLGTMIRYQLAAGAVLAVMAACQLRHVFRAQESRAGAVRRRLLPGSRIRIGFRPALGDRPMLWKELFTARPLGLSRVVLALVTLVGGGVFLYYAAWYGALAYLEMRDGGDLFAPGRRIGISDRVRFFYFLKFTLPFLHIAAIFGVAGTAAASISSEHEGDTWTSLTATDLTAREVLLAKWLGALWRPRRIVAAILVSTLAGIFVGSVHPISLPLLLACLATFGAFTATLGVWISLHLKSTWRAQFLTVSVFLLINLLGQALLNFHTFPVPMIWPAFTPYDVSKAIVAPWIRDEWNQSLSLWSFSIPSIDDGPVWTLSFLALGVAFYLAATVAMAALCLHKFEAVAGRARKSDQPAPTHPSPSANSSDIHETTPLPQISQDLQTQTRNLPIEA